MAVKFSIYLNRRVSVMDLHTCPEIWNSYKSQVPPSFSLISKEMDDRNQAEFPSILRKSRLTGYGRVGKIDYASYSKSMGLSEKLRYIRTSTY